MKQCNDCHETKPLDEYFKEKRVADGHQAICKVCMNIRKRKHRLANPTADHEYYLKNRDRLREQQKIKYATDDEFRAELSTKAKQYYLKNREAVKARVKARAEKNKAKLKAYHKEYRSRPDNLEKANERSRKYRANRDNLKVLAHRQAQYAYRKYEAKGFSTKQQFQWRWDYYGGKCYICNEDAREFDHVIPLTKGGSNWPANLKPICRSCNARKSNIWPYKPQLAIRS